MSINNYNVIFKSQRLVHVIIMHLSEKNNVHITLHWKRWSEKKMYIMCSLKFENLKMTCVQIHTFLYNILYTQNHVGDVFVCTTLTPSPHYIHKAAMAVFVACINGFVVKHRSSKYMLIFFYVRWSWWLGRYTKTLRQCFVPI